MGHAWVTEDVLTVLSSFAIGLVALLYLCSHCHVTINVPCLFLKVPWVGMWSVIVAFPGLLYSLAFFIPVTQFWSENKESALFVTVKRYPHKTYSDCDRCQQIYSDCVKDAIRFILNVTDVNRFILIVTVVNRFIL